MNAAGAAGILPISHRPARLWPCLIRTVAGTVAPSLVHTPSLRRNFTWTLAGNVVFAMSQWTIVAVITKAGSTSLAGDWTLGLALTAPIFIFAQLKLRTVQATDARHENRWGEFLSLRLLGLAVAVLAVLGVVLVAYPNRTGLLVGLIALAKVFDSMSDLVYGREQQAERMDRIAISLLVRGAFAAVLGSVTFVLTTSVHATALMTAAIYATCLGWDLRRVRWLLGDEHVGPVWDRSAVLRLFRRVLPLGIVTAIGSLQLNIPRYFVAAYCSREDLGVFGAISYVLVFGNMVVTALGHAAVPRLARYAAKRDFIAFRRALLRLIGVGLFLGVFGVVASTVLGRVVLRLLYNDAVAVRADVLVWMSVATALLWTYMFLGTALDALRRFRVQPWIHACSTAAIVATSSWFVPHHGLVGATWAMIAGYALDTVLYVLAVAIPIFRGGRDGT